MKKKRRSTLVIIVLVLLIGITSLYVVGTYAKYISEIAGNNGTVEVAKWAFTTDNANQTLTINLAQNYDPTTLVSGKIAPGTAGSFNVVLVNSTTETGVNFSIKLNEIANIPTNLKFYKDSSYTTELIPGTSRITGQLAAGDSTGVSVPVYWKWEYETAAIEINDPIDTQSGENANTLTIGVDITGTQTTPSTTGITSHID